MKNLKFLTLLVFVAFLISSCDKKDDNDNEPDGDCFVQLFDGDNYTDDHFTIRDAGDYPNLSNLPGADKDWDSEADSFKSGTNTTVTFWSERNFMGDSVTYQNGAQESVMNEPRSMKITCH